MANLEFRPNPTNAGMVNVLLDDVKVGWISESGGLWGVRVWDDAARTRLFEDYGSQETALRKVCEFFAVGVDFPDVLNV